nr:unnamed protein product [uncultured bacterium]
MKLTKETLLKKSIGDVIELCLKLNENNEELRKKIATLKQDKASKNVKETNKELRAENKRLKAQISTISKALGHNIADVENNEK